MINDEYRWKVKFRLSSRKIAMESVIKRPVHTIFIEKSLSFHNEGRSL